MKKKSIFAVVALALGMTLWASTSDNVIEEVAWMIGDEPIYKSEIEQAYQEMLSDRTPIAGDPYCVIPEQIAIERLFLHQADIDTIEVQESMVQMQVEAQLNYLITNLGSREKVEQYFRKPFAEIREYYATNMRNRSRVQQVRNNLTKNLKVTPSDVRRYFDRLPADSVPFVPLQVEVQVLTINPVIPRQEIDDVKARLRDFADRVNRGDTDFSTLAIMYSEDGSSMQGGELGFHGKADWVPEFANVAFNLNDPKKVSRIVETEYGYHIMQLIAKRGDQVNVRHILLTPRVNAEDLKAATNRLDSVRKEIVGGAFPFDYAARVISQDKDTRNNKGIMMNKNGNSRNNGSSRFEMQELPPEIAKRIETMSPGDISEAFVMRDASKNKDVAAIVRLTSRVEGHRANLADDYNMIKEMYENHKREEILKDWLENKIKDTYVRIEDGWGNCDFRYQGWVKEGK